jgi:hypothetical protein
MGDVDRSAPAVDPSTLLPGIIRHCLSEGDAASLALDRQFMNARFRAHQIARLVEFCSSNLTITFSTRSIARAFGVKQLAVTRASLRGYEDPPGRGRHRALDSDSERDLIAWITQKAANNTAVNKTELLHQCTTRFGAHITRG